MAGWNDRSATADAARDLLRQAAGISIPKAGFVMRVLAIYLLVLVPLNWIIFRSLGARGVGLGGNAHHRAWRDGGGR